MRNNPTKKPEPGLTDPGPGHIEANPASEDTDANVQTGSWLDWQSVDRALRRIKIHRAGLDAEEARWLREAEALQIWRPLGMVSALDYLERVLGYPPRAGQERLRVARALGTLPELTAALAKGAVAYSAVRELSRIVTPATEAEWLSHAKGKNLREIEDMVSGRRPGDRPDDPPDPDVRTRVIRLELSGDSFALFRQAQGALNEEHGRHLDDDELVHALCSAALEGAPAGESPGRARFQIAVTMCPRCRQGWQEGAGARIAIPADALERAMCDAQHIGSLDGDAPERAAQDVPPSVMRFVKQRDGGRCQVPGCRSARGLEVHHIVHRADGGGHDPNNLSILCGACHMAHHRGLLTISGAADQLEVRRPDCANENPHVGPTGEQLDSVATDTPAPTSSAVGVPSKLDAAAQRVANKPRREEGRPGAANANLPGARGEPQRRSIDDDRRSPANASRTIDPPNEERLDMHAPEDATPDPHVGSQEAQRRCVRGDGSHAVNPAFPVDRARTLVAATQPEECRQALVGLGWKSQIAKAATTAAIAALGEAAPLERLIADALRRCPRPLM